jgi:2,3-bisphosphoglycerate-independent phosphoglycerate mutase
MARWKLVISPAVYGGPKPFPKPNKGFITMDTRVLEIIIDGYGYDPKLEIDILASTFQALPQELKSDFKKNIFEKNPVKNKKFTDEIAFILFFNRNPLNIYFENKYGIPTILSPSDLTAVKEYFASLKRMDENQPLITQIKKLIETTAREKKYAVWAASTPTIDLLRENYPCISTKTTGIEAGYENLRPEVQGNSETGHQQLGNLAVAPQVPLEVILDIASGKFFENPLLDQAIKNAVDKKVNLNISFMISGELGDDGRVHSCWNHLESFLKLVFTNHHFDPARLRIQAILDGRDSPLKSSIEKEGTKYGFLFKLKDLLAQYNAADCITWIIGRGISMDRDYVEERTKKDYELLVKGKGSIAENFNHAVTLIRESHEKQISDPFIEPIIIKDKDNSLRKLENNDVFIDLNFRADRQRARIASLLGAKEFLQIKAAQREKEWKMDWIDENLKLDIFCLTEYDAEFKKLGAKIVYPIKPQIHNFLSLFCSYYKKQEIPFKYLLIAESNKAVHMGYFIKGRREKIENDEFEKRFIIPSYAGEDGINTDDDYYKTPHMKAFEITGKLLNELCTGKYKLAIINLSNADMLGHLINEHFDANIKALEVIDYAVKTIVQWALTLNYHIIITSDHGNIDEFSASHSLNDIITTFISPHKDIRLKKKPIERIRLFDIPWAIAEILNIKGEIEKILPPVPVEIKQRGLVGESPIEVIPNL